MRILTVGNMYPPHHQGGYELVWRSAVEHLRARGHIVGVLTTDHRQQDPDPSLAEDQEVERALRWYWRDHGFPRTGLRELLAIERHNAAVFDARVRRLQPDVVAWWSMGGMSLSLLERARRSGLPALGVVHDDWPLYGPRVDAWARLVRRVPPAAPLVGLVPPPSLGAGTRWTFNSSLQYERVRSALSDPPERIDRPGVARRLFREHAPREWSGRLLYCGRLDPRKGVDLAVEALALVPAVTLSIVGGGDPRYADELRALAARSGVSDRLRIAGAVARADLPAAYAEADAVLFPVRWQEPWGLVPLEAMAVGRPVIASGRGGSGEYLVPEENALLVDPDAGPRALAAAIERLAADPALRERLRAGGLATAARYDQAGFDSAIEELLAELAR